MTAQLKVLGSTAPWSGGNILPGVDCILAPNPSVMTLDGTNTWLIGPAGGRELVVVDPGPDEPRHLDAVLAAIERRDARATAVLLTHGHLDHSEGAVSLARRLGVGVRALDPAHRLGSEGLTAGQVVGIGDWDLQVLATPGHSADSLSFVLSAAAAIMTGDTVLGRGTTVVAHPDGTLGDYLASLERLRVSAEESHASRVLPGHGPDLPDPVSLLDDYLEHRRQRLEQVRATVAAGASTPAEVVEIVYADVPRAAWPAAELSVAAQMEYLRNGSENC